MADFRRPCPQSSLSASCQFMMSGICIPRRIPMYEATKFFKVILWAAAISGCTTAALPPAAPAIQPPVPAVSFDGNYRGTIQLASTSRVVSGAAGNWCDTPPTLSLSVRNNEFRYILTHPHLPQDSSDSLSPIFEVTIRSTGTFRASNRNGTSEIMGMITGSHMVGEIRGSGCSYTFTADRL